MLMHRVFNVNKLFIRRNYKPTVTIILYKKCFYKKFQIISTEFIVPENVDKLSVHLTFCIIIHYSVQASADISVGYV